MKFYWSARFDESRSDTSIRFHILCQSHISLTCCIRLYIFIRSVARSFRVFDLIPLTRGVANRSLSVQTTRSAFDN